MALEKTSTRTERVETTKTYLNLLNIVRITTGKDQWKFTVTSMKSILQGTTRKINFILKWYGWVPLNVNVFSWTAQKECIATRTTLSRRGVHLDSQRCPLYEDFEETTERFLVSYFVAHIYGTSSLHGAIFAFIFIHRNRSWKHINQSMYQIRKRRHFRL